MEGLTYNSRQYQNHTVCMYKLLYVRPRYCMHTLTRHSWIHYTDCWIVK